MTLSLKDRVAELPAAQRKRWWTKLPTAMKQSILMRTAWWFEGRPEQQTPKGRWRFWLICAGRGWGKMIDATTPIPTPTGWTKLGDLAVGDTVLDEAGRPTTILAVFDGVPEVAYRVHFSDGTYIDACSEHQWVTWTHAERKAYLRSKHEPDRTQFPLEWPTWQVARVSNRYLKRDAVTAALKLAARGLSARRIAAKLGLSRQALAPHLAAGRYMEPEPRRHMTGAGPRIRTTQELYETQTYGLRGDLNHCIPTCGPLQLPDADLLVDPYVLGAWLGDGSTGAGAFTCHADDQPELITQLKRCGYAPQVGQDKRGQTVGTRRLAADLARVGVLRDKHVPAAYLRASAEQRLALLQGLMDTDGYAGDSHVEFCNTRKPLVDAVVELARSLGQKPRVTEGRAVLNGRDTGPKWRVMWRPTVPVFRLARKAAALPGSGAQALRNHHRMITRIERISSVPMRCLTVDAPNSMFLAGEGMIPTHNTRVGAEWAAEKARRYPGARIALVAATFADGRDTMVEGISGLLSVLHHSELKGGTASIAWNRSLGELVLANGSRFKIYSSERPRQLRGANNHFAWGDEPAYWADVEQGTGRDSTFSNLNFGLRLPPLPGWERDYRPQAVFTTTPRRVPLLKMPDDVIAAKPQLAGLLQRTDTIVTGGKTMDNIDNLDQSYREAVIEPLIGTSLSAQELEGIMLEDLEGALWTTALISGTRLDAAPTLNRIVVAFDPSGGKGYGHDEHGIVVIGAAGDRRHQQFYLLEDLSANTTPEDAAKRAIFAWIRYGASRIVYEKNQGQDWIPQVFKGVWGDLTTKRADGKIELPEYEGQPAPLMEAVSAVKNKEQRATPVAMLAQQHRVHHVGMYPILENQLTTWVPDEGLASPDRLDAYVWGISWLMEHGPGTADVASAAQLERRDRNRGARRTTRAALPAVPGMRPGRARYDAGVASEARYLALAGAGGRSAGSRRRPAGLGQDFDAPICPVTFDAAGPGLLAA